MVKKEDEKERMNVSIQLTVKEYEIVKMKSIKEHRSVSDIFRRAVFGYEVK